MDTKLGEYVLHYAGGAEASIPIVYGRNVADWRTQPGDPVPSDAEIAWTGENAAARETGCDIRLYTCTVHNPRKEAELLSIDIVSSSAGSAPFVVALTYEPLQTEYEWFDAIRPYNSILPRSSQAPPDLVDLTGHFNASLDDDWFHHAGHDFQDVSKGVHELCGTLFDLRGLIQLAGTQSLRVSGLALPEAVRGIRVGRKGKRVHFLQACGWSAGDGEKIGEYIIHYAGGETRTAPILYRENVMDWWFRPETGHVSGAGAAEVWHGCNPSTYRMGYGTRLIRYTWENPLPGYEIAAIDFVSCVAAAAPQLMAITIEPG